MKKHAIFALAAASSLLLFSGCGAAPLKSGSHPPVTKSGWVVSWDREKGWEAYDKTKERWGSISYFAVTFDEKGELKVPSDLPKTAGIPFHLTFVNDVIRSNGHSTEKDTEILRHVLRDEHACRMHVKEILAIAETCGADGIDIDYERIGKDPELVEAFARFTKLLYLESIPTHKKIRIILEPSMPMDVSYSVGPEYVVMLYNLYGLHSGPGPKADGPFIEKTIRRMQALPGKKAVAFSNGGCLWKDAGLFGLLKGTPRFITTAEVVKLRDAHGTKEERDEASAALHFSYQEDGHSYEVWYADEETLEAWTTLAANRGIPSVSLWRLGG